MQVTVALNVRWLSTSCFRASNWFLLVGIPGVRLRWRDTRVPGIISARRFRVDTTPVYVIVDA